MNPLYPLAWLIAAMPALADEPVIEAARAEYADGVWTVFVTLRHADTGWDDYADGWEVLDQDGVRLGYRELFHPHVNEQPFTRSLAGVSIPEGTRSVFVRARDNVGGWGDTRVELRLPETGG